MNTREKQSNDLFENNNISDTANQIEVAPLADAAQKTANRQKPKSSTAFRTISEVAKYLDVQQHVLRFWETKFTQVKPLKRGGGRRYYRPEDMSLLQAIHHLLYVEGYTIKGVQKLLREVGKKQIISRFSGDNLKDLTTSHKTLISDIEGGSIDVSSAKKIKKSDSEKREILQSVLSDLKDLRGSIKSKK